MQWHTLYSSERLGQRKESAGQRSVFQRDFDRLIFSSAFRRLQNKTQVFPLPGSTFVHNRLTHSLEVASVGRSLGSMVGEKLAAPYRNTDEASYEFYRYELANVIAAGCLAHDIGNPAFGHSGEKAISAYFLNHSEDHVNGERLRDFFSDKEWADLSNFEGNANALRILTRVFKGRIMGGLGLTYTTIASIIKYPCESTAIHKKFRHRKKYGFFQSEIEPMKAIADQFGLRMEQADPLVYQRHPFVYLVEAADDICYSIIDMEDAHRLGILSHELVRDSFLHVIRSLAGEEKVERTLRVYEKVEDKNEQIAFLRSGVINLLTEAAAEIFLQHSEEILAGTFNDSLLDCLEREHGSLSQVERISIEKIYNHETVLEVEIAGYNVMSELLGIFVPALLKKKPDHKDEKIMRLFPLQYTGFKDTESAYEKVMNAIDLISGMTDEYATELYRKLKGIEIPRHK